MNFIADIQAFTQYYTNIVALVNKPLLEKNLSLDECRVLVEIASQTTCTPIYVTEQLSIDSGYLIRIIERFEREGILTRHSSGFGGSASSLSLTANGQDLVNTMNQVTERAVEGMIKHLDEQQLTALVNSMHTIQQLIANRLAIPSITIRHDLRPGDLGLVTRYHGLWYAPEFGYDMSFEGYVAETVSEFAENYSPKRDRLWIAEVDGRFVGCIAIVGRLATVGQLRWFLLDKSVRGQGVGKQLVDLALAFGREQHYKSLYLLTTTDQTTAHRVYKRAGFELTDEHEPVQMWGQTIREQRYELIL